MSARARWVGLGVVGVLLALGTRCTLHVASQPTDTTEADAGPVTQAELDALVREPSTWVGERPPNVLLLLSDDIGLELVGPWGLDDHAVALPTLQALMDRGVSFDRAYAMPSCSPTRAAMLTGRYGRHYGIGGPLRIGRRGEPSLPDAEVSLPEVLHADPRGAWRTALVGKWHLTTIREDALHAPGRQGFDTHIGSIGNLQNDHSVDGQPQNYYDWEKVVDGEVHRTHTYATTDEVDDALRLVRTMPEPFFLQVSFHASHYPWQPPPAELTHDGNDGSGGKEAQRYRAIVDALDHEMGRLLDGLPTAIADDTIVIYLSDNGSDPRAMMAAYKGHASKGFVSELGVRVPLVVAGPGVDGGGRWDHSLVHAVDLFATVLDLAGVPRAVWPDDLDSVSFAPRLRDPSAPEARDVVFAEQFQPNGDGPYKVERIMIRDDRYKLVRDGATGVDQLFLLDGSLLEGDDLLEGTPGPEIVAVHERLAARLATGDY